MLFSIMNPNCKDRAWASSEHRYQDFFEVDKRVTGYEIQDFEGKFFEKLRELGEKSDLYGVSETEKIENSWSKS